MAGGLPDYVFALELYDHAKVSAMCTVFPADNQGFCGYVYPASSSRTLAAGLRGPLCSCPLPRPLATSLCRDAALSCPFHDVTPGSTAMYPRREPPFARGYCYSGCDAFVWSHLPHHLVQLNPILIPPHHLAYYSLPLPFQFGRRAPSWV